MDMKKKFMIAAGSVGAAAVVVTAATTGAKLLMSEPRIPENFTITAHTGCEGTKDNSVDSITVGFVSGADIVEFDLHFTSEGVPVLAHDEPEEDSVLLDEAFRYIALYKGLLVNVDVKNSMNLAEVKALAEKHGVLDRIFYTGIGEEDVETVRNDSPDVPYYLNVDVDALKNKDKEYISSLIEKVKTAGAVGINFKYTQCSRLLVDMFHGEGLSVSIWTVNNRFDMKKALSYGADNVTTRKVTSLREVMAPYTDKVIIENEDEN